MGRGGRDPGEGKARKGGWGEEREVLEKEMKGRLGIGKGRNVGVGEGSPGREKREGYQRRE
jgi:hypothetical protein